MSATRDRRKRDKDIGGKADVRTEKPPARQKPKSEASFTPPDDSNRQMYERTVYMTMNLVGRVVQVQVKSGAIYEGILHTAQTEKGFGVVLKMARKKEQGSTSALSETLIIQPKDFVQLTAKEVAFDDVSNEEAFMTDTDISGRADMRERELQPWVPESDYSVDVSLSVPGYKSSTWDQFATNEKLFGVTTNYDEEIYTTKLDKESPLYLKNSRAAQRIADEIERKTANNFHLAEERGQIDADDMDEEERYSSVIRPGGKYVPPQKRTQENNKDRERDLRASSEMVPPSSEDDLRHSADSPTPMSPKDKHPSVTERLRLRRVLVNEAHRTSPTPNDSKPQSPLLSPLVGDPKTITALGLEPRAPSVNQGVVRDFLEFSLNEKAKQNPASSREVVTADFKQFSLSFNKRPNSPLHGSAPSSPMPASPAPADATKTATTTTPPKTATLPVSTATTTTAPSTPAATTAASPAVTPTASATPTLRPLGSKLNPNAPAFTPQMSAKAPPFVPKVQYVPPPVLAPLMPPSEQMYFHQIKHHPHLQPQPPQYTSIMVADTPISEVYCDAMKRKGNQENSETTTPYWFGRGSYRTNVEDMDPNLHRQPQPYQPPIGVVVMNPGHPPHPHAHPHPHPHPHQMAMGPNFPSYVMSSSPMGMMNMPPVPMPGGPQPQVVTGPIFMGQPGMRPYPPPGVHQPAPIGMAPQASYVAFSPQMTPHSPPGYQPVPQHQPPQQPPPVHGPQPPHVFSVPPQPIFTPQQPHGAHAPALVHPHSPQPHPHSPQPHPHAPATYSPQQGAPPGTAAQPPLGGGLKRAFFPHSPTQHPPHSPNQAIPPQPTQQPQPQQTKPGYASQTRPL